MKKTYKASGIVYDTDGFTAGRLPDTLTVTAENKDGVADAISAITGKLVESINTIELVIPTSEELFKEYDQVLAEADNAVSDLLNTRGITSINVKAYADNDDVDHCSFPQQDKNGYGALVSIDTIRKDKKLGWVADCVDEDGYKWGTLGLDASYFDAESLLHILEMIEQIFAVADEKYNGKIPASGQEFDDLEENDN